MKRIYFTMASNERLEDFNKLRNSFFKFNPNEELRLFDELFVKGTGDPNFFYRAKPYIASQLFKEGYTGVCGLDADQIILGNLDEIWEGDYDVATVLNDPTFPINLLDIQPYFNNGLVVMKNKDFVEHWLRLCYSNHFDKFQYREQDLLNLLTSDYMNYRVKCLDYGDCIYGEFAKAVWKNAKVEGDKVMVSGKQLKVVHFGGGSGDPSKGNYRIRFQNDVVKFIDEAIK